MTGDDTSGSEFMRRKFTLPESFDRRLQALAAQHYSGNVSLCIRAAIEDHESTLTDNESLSLHRIEQQIKSLDSDLDALREPSETTAVETEQTGRSHEFGTLGFDDNQSATMHRVYEEFTSDGMALRLADLIDRLEDSPEAIVCACEHLLDIGYLVEGSKSRRYHRPTLEGS